MKRISIILLFFVASHVSAQTSPWEPMNRGLLHTLVYTIEIDPVDSLRMYCGTDYGNIYTSTDGGFNWALSREGIPSDYNQEYVSALYLDKTDTRVLYAGFGGRHSEKNLFKSIDRGRTWSIVSTPAIWKQRGILHILRLKTNPVRLVCGLGWSQGIYLSTNDGSAWEQELQSDGIQTINSHPLRPTVLLAGSSRGRKLLRSVDAGGSWTQSINGMTSIGEFTGVRSISFDPSNPDLVYAGVTGAGCGLHRSTDAGVNWTRLNQTAEISEIAIHPDDPKLIYITAIGTGAWRSRDGGATWTRIVEGLPTMDVMRVRIAPGYPVRVFAVTLKHGIFRMVDEEI